MNNINTLKRKRGAPIGNQNARKHGFYSRVITKTEKRDLKRADDMKGIDQEINLLRVRLKSILLNDPENNHLILQATTTLAHLLRTKHYLGNTDETSLREIIENVLTELALPFGVDIGKFINRQSE